MAAKRIKRRQMSEINVVPYIDVMLVLLVIFMITTPLLTQGVHVDLPQASAKAISPKQKKPVVISVAPDGRLYIDNEKKASKPARIVAYVKALMRLKPGTRVLIRGHDEVPYARVVEAMVLIQKAGVSSVGLVTKTPDQGK